MPRLFVALRPPPAVRAALIATMDGITAARWQDDDQLHLTLRFIGDVERPVAEDVAACLAQVHAPAPLVRLDGVGRFGEGSRGHAIWAGVSPRDALARLHRKVDQACVRAGLPPEGRAYLPHVTVARLTRTCFPDPWLARHAGLSSAVFPLSHMLLYQSFLDRAGARYEAVARWPLEPSDAGNGSPLAA